MRAHDGITVRPGWPLAGLPPAIMVWPMIRTRGIVREMSWIRRLFMIATGLVAVTPGCRTPSRSPQARPQPAHGRSPQVSAAVITYTVRDSAAVARKYPSSARAHFKLGLAYYKMRRYQEAISELLKAHRLDAKQQVVLAWLGYSYHAQGNSAAAADVFERLVRMPMPTGELADAYNRLGYYYEELGKSGEAERCHLVALHYDPKLGAASFALGTLAARQGRFNEARSYFESASINARDGRERAAALARMGEMSEEQGDSVAARASYRDALASDPGRADAMAGMKRLSER